jgi:hypothetical protein
MPSTQYGPWTITGSREVFRSEFITLRHDDVRKPDGSPGTYTTARVKSGVAVLPVDEHGQVYLVKQFRYAIGRDSVEVISGGIDDEEPPAEAVRREAEEEAGIVAGSWTELGYVDLDTSIVKGPVYLFWPATSGSGNARARPPNRLRGAQSPLRRGPAAWCRKASSPTASSCVPHPQSRRQHWGIRVLRIMDIGRECVDKA